MRPESLTWLGRAAGAALGKLQLGSKSCRMAKLGEEPVNSPCSATALGDILPTLIN